METMEIPGPNAEALRLPLAEVADLTDGGEQITSSQELGEEVDVLAVLGPTYVSRKRHVLGRMHLQICI